MLIIQCANLYCSFVRGVSLTQGKRKLRFQIFYNLKQFKICFGIT